MAFLKFRGNTTSPAKPLSTTAADAPLSNLDIDGNFASLNDSKLELTGHTSGDIFYANASGIITKLAKGSDGQVLKLASGIPSWNTDNDTIYTLLAATSTVLGGIKLGSNTVQTVAANEVTTTAERTYALQVNSDGQAVVNVPWVDSDTNTDTLQSIDADTTNADRFVTFVSSATGTQSGLSHTKLLYNPSTSTLSSDNFNSTSDLRLKKDLQKIDFALTKLKTLTGYTFTMTESNTRSTGLIAQDVEKILPEVIGGNEEKKTLNYGAMLGLVVEAIKELDDKLEDIRNTILNK